MSVQTLASFNAGVCDVLTRSLLRHLIADHLGWFKDSTDGGSLRTVEDFMRAKGEQAKWGYIDEGGDIQIIPNDES